MSTLIFDTEVFPNYFLAAFLDLETGRVATVEVVEGDELDIKKLRRLMTKHTLVGFNSASFDLPVCRMALAGEPPARIKAAANSIIGRNLTPWQFDKQWPVAKPIAVDHVDLIEVAPGIASLKIYGGRLHSRKMQDLPYDHMAHVDEAQREQLRAYCANDLELTADLYRSLKPQIELRASMGEQYGIDLRSKSDAQIAEAVLTREVEAELGRPIERPVVEPGTVARYRVPEFIQFKTEALQAKLEAIAASEIVVQANGSVAEPPALAGATVAIGQGVYRLGIGGLHSSETRAAHRADDEHVLIDRDVASFYPAIILRLGLYPEQMGPTFLRVYQSIVDRRLAAKAAGDKVTADTLKICVNGSFGKLGSKYSKLYSPDLLIQVTVTGQLALLMLIEALECADIRVVSANTDGIVIKAHRDDVQKLDAIVSDWETRTGFKTEDTHYSALYSRDVNNYVALKPGGGAKLKGTYAIAGLAKNPANSVCVMAVLKYLADGTPVHETIRSCKDIRQFVTIRQVKGGAVKDGAYLGKAVRWYYSTTTSGTIQYQTNGYTVARSDGARPLMDLPEEFPADVDFAWYERESLSILCDIGAFNDLI